MRKKVCNGTTQQKEAVKAYEMFKPCGQNIRIQLRKKRVEIIGFKIGRFVLKSF